MSDTTEINGRASDTLVRSRIADIASDLCPLDDNDARMAYAALILGWILRGESLDARYARTQSVDRAYQNHSSAAWSNRIPGKQANLTILFPDFQAEAEKLLKFIGGES